MAREESDREDLLREATALVERIALAPKDSPGGDHIVVGFRRSGEASVFFGAEPVYHFNAVNELRRAYANGRLYKADQGRLAAMERIRTAESVELRRHDLSADKQLQFVADMLQRLRDLRDQIERGKYTVVGQVPAEADVLGRVRQWLGDRHAVNIAPAPHVGKS